MFTNETQLDLFYLLCGLALFLVGGLTPILNRRTQQLLPWKWLGMFAVCRGIYEVLSLPMLSQVMPAYFEGVRILFLLFGLIFLMEFGRAGSLIGDVPVPWWWIYLVLAASVLFVRLFNLADLMDTLRLALSLVGGLWAAWAMLKAAPKLTKGQETLTVAAIIMALYALASCVDGSESFVAGVPIQLIQGLLLLGLGISLCRLCQIAMQRMMERPSQKLYQYLAQGTTIGLIFIAAVGLVGILGINYFSNRAAADILANNQKTVNRLKEVIDNEMEKADRLVQLLAVSSRVYNALTYSSDAAQIARAHEILDRYSQTEEGYGICYVMNPNGITIASSNRNQPDSFIGKDYGFRPYFKQASLGLQGRYFALGVTSADLGYYTSSPVRNDKGAIIGVVVIKRMIRTVGELKNAFDPKALTFLVDPHGIIVLSNQTANVLRSLWRLDEAESKEVIASGQFGRGPFPAILDQKPTAGKDYLLAGQRRLALTQPILMEGWTLYHFGSTQAIPWYRLMGAGAIFAFGLALIGFYVSWDWTSYQAANLAGVDPAKDGDFISARQAEEELHQGEMKYQNLVNHIGLMAEMGDLLQGCKNSQEAMPVISRYMSRLFPDLSGGLYLASSDQAVRFELSGTWGDSPPRENAFYNDDCWALRRGRSYVVDDPGNSLLCHHLSEAWPSGYQCWPIVAQGETLGVFHLRQPRNWGNSPPLSGQQKEVTQQLITSLVEQIALTLTNLKLRAAASA